MCGSYSRGHGRHQDANCETRGMIRALTSVARMLAREGGVGGGQPPHKWKIGMLPRAARLRPTSLITRHIRSTKERTRGAKTE